MSEGDRIHQLASVMSKDSGLDEAHKTVDMQKAVDVAIVSPQRRSAGTSKISSISAAHLAPSKASAASNTGESSSKTIFRSPPLDFSQIRTSAPSRLPPRTTARLFGLEHCPIFYPSVDEFADPLEYIDLVSKDSKIRGFGMCKIIPPEGWQPPFAHDTETFRFTTRLQRLNSMEASARANLNFLEQLYLFHKQQKRVKISIPIIGGKPVDLWRLRKEVTTLGGVETVSEQRKWTQISTLMRFDLRSDPSIPAQIKHAYLNIIQPFEDYRVRILANSTPHGTPSSSRGDMRSTPQNRLNASDASAGPSSASPITLQKVQAASDKLNAALNASPAPNHASPAASQSEAVDESPDTPAVPKPGDLCEICQSDHDEESILLCDDCDRGYHLQCLEPPLAAVPRGDWICDTCIVTTGADYGFEEGNEHSFGSFHKMATAFRQDWLERHPLPEREVPFTEWRGQGEDWAKELAIEEHLEREFWRLIEKPQEDVEVEYGADLHTSTCGSAIPVPAKFPNNPYARDGWNLNNLPIIRGSLLRYVKSDICGMTVPWGYVGMLFSTFAWHKEDHYTYSVNYHHWGGTKTWYGVPGEDDQKLEDAMKEAAPELFQQQPDLMFQLVTLMSPGRLKKAGVRVSVCDQRPNEFVITFPKAYHAGFNHDMNYNEAVNFCLPDWLKEDLNCVKRYREMSKPPVFSHDELLMTIFLTEKSQDTAIWLLPLFEEMVSRELADRLQARNNIPSLLEIVEERSQADGPCQCKVDNSYCYLSQITTASATFVTCVEHYAKLGEEGLLLVTRQTDLELLDMLKTLQSRADGSDSRKARPNDTNHKRQISNGEMGSPDKRLRLTFTRADSAVESVAITASTPLLA